MKEEEEKRLKEEEEKREQPKWEIKEALHKEQAWFKEQLRKQQESRASKGLLEPPGLGGREPGPLVEPDDDDDIHPALRIVRLILFAHMTTISLQIKIDQIYIAIQSVCTNTGDLQLVLNACIHIGNP